MSAASWCSTCFCAILCYLLYGPFCHSALKLDISTLFTPFFVWPPLQFILLFLLTKHLLKIILYVFNANKISRRQPFLIILTRWLRSKNKSLWTIQSNCSPDPSLQFSYSNKYIFYCIFLHVTFLTKPNFTSISKNIPLNRHITITGCSEKVTLSAVLHGKSLNARNASWALYHITRRCHFSFIF